MRIPIESQADVARRQVPEKFFGPVNEKTSTLVAEAVITHPTKVKYVC